MMIFVYDVILGYIMPFILCEYCINVLMGGAPGQISDGFAYLRRLRVRHLEYWHPEPRVPKGLSFGRLEY